MSATFSDGHVLFAQLLSSLLQGSHTAPGSRRCVWGEKTGSEFSLPSSALPGSTRAAAEPSKGPAASGFASAWATQGGWEGEAGARWHPRTCCAGFSPPPLVLSQWAVVGNGFPALSRAAQMSRKRFFGSHFFPEAQGEGQVLHSSLQQR